ncbi:phosphoketolase [Atractiella rhizophila]|nr:phosphoketolase [Atractiella rhizophila]
MPGRANYISVAQIFLQSNALLDSTLQKSDVKKRLLGHWGTCPGLTLLYSHWSSIVTRSLNSDPIKSIFVTGPGHGAPSVLSCLYLEGTITHFYPQYSLDKKGFEKFTHDFSFPKGFPSHCNSETPGQIHEGGELGYALAVAYGSVMDDPDLVTLCVVGDGESETGPTATAWHAHKYIDPTESGAVLPVLHLNEFKISERTIPGAMTDESLVLLYTGYGYQVRFVEYPYPLAEEKLEHLNADMAVSLEWALGEIRAIQKDAREGNGEKKRKRPLWPMIILRSPKGMGCPRTLNGKPLEGSFAAHQVPLAAANKDDEQLKMLEHWLKSYEITEFIREEELKKGAKGELFDLSKIKGVVPEKPEYRLGMVKVRNNYHVPLNVPEIDKFAVDISKEKESSTMQVFAAWLAEVVKKNPTTFRIFSPDEFVSNKLDKVFQVTSRQQEWDGESKGKRGRVIEMLSEHTLQGFLQGYTLTGRTGLFPSYEAFLGIVTTMASRLSSFQPIAQYSKFRKMALETKWRGDVSSLNYLETSTLWRQEHNGYSHQNPALIGSLLNLPRHMTRIYFPPDGNTMLSVMHHCFKSKNYVNLVVGSKNPTTNFLTLEEAKQHCLSGISVWKKYSTDEGKNPDVILVGIGVEVTVEVIAAAKLLQKEGFRVRTINVVDLMVLSEERGHPHALGETAFNSLFGKNIPVVINFHGYPTHVKGLLFSRHQAIDRRRFDVHGYMEEGTTTTPWSMLHVNQASRYDIANKAVELYTARNPNGPLSLKCHELQAWLTHTKLEQARFAEENGFDSDTVGTVEVS